MGNTVDGQGSDRQQSTAKGDETAPSKRKTKTRIRAKQPGRYHHGDLRRALLDATLVLIGREGTGRGLSLRAAARLAGVSEAAPYRHFTDKRALIAAVAEEGFEKMEAALAEVTAGDIADPLERFQALGVVYVRFACAHPAHYKVMFGPEMTDKSAYPSLETVAQQAFAHLARAVSDCQGAGLLRPGDPRELALAAWSAVHGLSSLVVDGQVRIVGFEPEEAERLAASVSRDLLSGLTDANR